MTSGNLARRAEACSPFAGLDVPHLLGAQAEDRPDADFVTWEPFEGDRGSWTYREAVDLVARAAGALSDRGVRPGQHVLVHLENRPESVVAFLACARLGAVAVMTNTRSSRDEIAYFARVCGAAGAVTQRAFATDVAAAAPWTVVVDGDDGGGLDGDPLAAPLRAPDPAAMLSVQFTSGTTARPKGVQWTHANALWSGRVAAAHLAMRPDDVSLVHMPLFHTVALGWQFMAALYTGSAVVLQPRFSARRFWDVSVRNGATVTCMVPFHTRALRGQDVPDHRYRVWTNAFDHPRIEAHFRVRMLGCWGMSEAVGQVLVADLARTGRAGSMGRSATEYTIAVENDGGPVRAGETGDLLVGGTPGLSLFAGYLGDPAATEAAFDDRGLLRTGDRVTLLPGGDLRFSDRAKDMLKVGGENVASSEIEAVVAAVRGVAEVAVVGRPHPMLDEVPVAFVVAREADPGLPERVTAACREVLADFKVPREVRLIESLPTSTLEKVAKAKLRALVADPAS